MKILITGAHFTPAQAVIEELKKDTSNQIIYIGRKYTQEGEKILSVESQVLPSLGVKFIPITAGRLRRILDLRTVTALFKIPIGFIQAFCNLVIERPDVVLSFGGYIGLPVVISAWFLSIPVMIHEQTLVTGLANTLSNFFADKIAVSFEKDYPISKQKIELTGNPIRKEILKPTQNVSKDLKEFLKIKKIKKLPIIYVTGGNQGSDLINQAILELLDKLSKFTLIIHQTGDSKKQYFDKLSKLKTSLPNPEGYLVKKWFNASEVGHILKEADLAISRAGANTLLELALFSLPSIIIPIPYLYKNEQEVNAKYFKQYGLCQVIEQNQFNSKKLYETMLEALANIKVLKKSALKAKALVKEDAAKIIAQELILLKKENV